MEQILTFDQLPQAVTLLTKEVSELKRLLIEKQEPTSTTEPDQLLTIQQAADLLGLSITTLYTKVSKRELPVCKAPGSKRLHFLRSELMDYIKSGRKKTNAEIEQEAETYLLTKRK